jgi:tRNA-specific 2-thiouridylase
MELANTRNIQYVATGHYARVHTSNGTSLLARATDERKDQTYFLYRVYSQWLSRLLFPLGNLTKSEVWNEAEAMGLPADELKESQEICFVTQGDYRTFIEKETPEAKRPGLFIDEAGRPLGQHEGIAFYTPGQRRGLGIATGQRLYVQRVHPAANTVVLGSEDSLRRQECTVGDLNILAPYVLQGQTEAQIKVRYATPPTPALLSPLTSSTIRVRFREAQRALSPGQSAVFYEGDHVLGGGIIQAF